MEEENHSLLQSDATEVEQTPHPQLQLILFHAVNGISSTATFALIITIGGGERNYLGR
jgi:hypothetical protein